MKNNIIILEFKEQELREDFEKHFSGYLKDFFSENKIGEFFKSEIEEEFIYNFFKINTNIVISCKSSLIATFPIKGIYATEMSKAFDPAFDIKIDSYKVLISNFFMNPITKEKIIKSLKYVNDLAL